MKKIILILLVLFAIFSCKNKETIIPDPTLWISVSPNSATITINGTQQLVAIISPGDAPDKTVIWSSSAASVASVSESGFVTGVALGSAVITARPREGNKTATCSITVTGATTAVNANDFLNSLGICLGTESSNQQYTTMLNYIGIRNFRCGSLRERDAETSIALAQATDTKVLWLLESGWAGTSVLPDIEAAKQVASAGVLLAIEGVNEPDNWTITYQGQVGGGGDDAPANPWLPVAYLQRDLYTAVKSDPVLKDYPVFSISHGGAELENVGLQFLVTPSDFVTIGGITPGTKYADYANMHNYVIWENCTGHIDNEAWNSADPCVKIPPTQYPLKSDYGVTWKKDYVGYNDAQLLTLPRVTTETGWPSNVGGEEAQGICLINVYLAQYKRDYKYTFLYQLRDNEGGFVNQFGVFHIDYSPKSAAKYIHNLTTILADSISVSAPGQLNYYIASKPATLHDLLLQKSNGKFELVIWNERVSGSNNVIVNLGRNYNSVKIYDLTIGTSPTQTLSNASSVTLTMSDHPVIIEIGQ